jgi:hypothetical protein
MITKYYHWAITRRFLVGVPLLALVLLFLAVPTVGLIFAPNPEAFWRMVPGAALFVVGFGFAGGSNLIQAIAYLRNPAREPLMRQLARYGNPLEVARQIDAELAANEGVLYLGNWSSRPWPFGLRGLWVTPSWMVQVHLQNVAAVQLADLEWVEEARMPTQWNRGDEDRYKVGLVSGERVLFLTTCEEGYRLYLALSERCPWILDLKRWGDRKRAGRPAERADRKEIQAEPTEEPSGPDA